MAKKKVPELKPKGLSIDELGDSSLAVYHPDWMEFFAGRVPQPDPEAESNIDLEPEPEEIDRKEAPMEAAGTLGMDGPIVVFKQTDGIYRWVLFSSNGFEDREDEIVSTAALEADCARADATKEYGPLRWWHVGKPDPARLSPGPGADIGVCDFNALHGRILIESGTFDNARYAQAVKAKADNLQASIGYFHPKTEPDREGVFSTIHRFERSILPRGRASNQFTRLPLIEKIKESSMIEEKIQQLKDLFGGGQEAEEVVDRILQEADKTEKAALDTGVSYKEGNEGGDDNDNDNIEGPFVGDMSPDDFASMIAKVIDGAMEPHRKELTALQTAVSQKDDAQIALKEAVEAVSGRLKSLEEAVDDLQGSKPRALQKGYRPSQDKGTVVKEGSQVEGERPGPDPEFMEFMLTGATPEG